VKKLYKFYYIGLISLGIIFSIALYESYQEKEELKGVILKSYSHIIKTTIHDFIKIKSKNNLNNNTLKEFMTNLELEYKDFDIKFLFPENKQSLKEALKHLKELEKDGFYQTPGFFNRIYYLALKDKNIKAKYQSLFIPNTENIIGILIFKEDEQKDNIAGDLEENFGGKEILFISVWLILAISGYFLLRILNEKNKLEIEKEVAKKNEQLKSEFLANMSHEIRTPLNAMFGFINLLETKNLDVQSKKYLNIIKKSGEVLLNIINDILDFSKIEAGKMNIEKVSFNLKDEIRTIYTLFEAQANEKNIKLNIKESNVDVNVVTDPTRLKQIISNLLSNSIKFTPEGKNIYFTILYDDKKEEIFVKIKDEGVGIESSKLEHIFQPFSQEDSSTTRKYGGTGLGLTISNNLVQLLGGSLEVKSEKNKGSEFSFRIPAKKNNKVVQIQKEKKVVSQSFDYHILVAEDNKANQMFMEVMLKKLGLTFDIANDGIEAVELYKKHYKSYKLILMDENMPNMTGSEALQEILKFEKEHKIKHVPIIVITANALSGDKEKFLELGFDYYLAKPLNLNDLSDILKRIE